MKKRFLTIALTIVFLAVFSVAFFFIYTNKSVLGEQTDVIWDGSTVATSFSGGNGTKDNPYLIRNGEELAYLKNVLDSEQAEGYKGLYYELTADINLGSHDLGPIALDTTFSGTLDGKGHVIKNVSITGENDSEKDNYYGLFGNIDNAKINNLNIDEMKITVKGAGVTYLGALAGKVNNETETKNSITNISLKGIEIDLTEAELAEESNVGTIIGEIGTNYEIRNIVVYGSINASSNDYISKLTNMTSSDINNVVYDIKSELELQKEEHKEETKIENVYEFKDNKYYLGEEEKSLESILVAFNKELNDYKWELVED